RLRFVPRGSSPPRRPLRFFSFFFSQRAERLASSPAEGGGAGGPKLSWGCSSRNGAGASDAPPEAHAPGGLDGLAPGGGPEGRAPGPRPAGAGGPALPRARATLIARRRPCIVTSAISSTARRAESAVPRLTKPKPRARPS